MGVPRMAGYEFGLFARPANNLQTGAKGNSFA
jgi:hypothetical protein